MQFINSHHWFVSLYWEETLLNNRNTNHINHSFHSILFHSLRSYTLATLARANVRCITVDVAESVNLNIFTVIVSVVVFTLVSNRISILCWGRHECVWLLYIYFNKLYAIIELQFQIWHATDKRYIMNCYIDVCINKNWVYFIKILW